MCFHHDNLFEAIRNLDAKNREMLLKENFLESMRAPVLEAILDLQYKIELIIIDNSLSASKIEKIKELMNNPGIEAKIHRIMEDLGAKRIEDLSMFADTILAVAEPQEKIEPQCIF